METLMNIEVSVACETSPTKHLGSQIYTNKQNLGVERILVMLSFKQAVIDPKLCNFESNGRNVVILNVRPTRGIDNAGMDITELLGKLPDHHSVDLK